jgi:cardiolipin-specific phospholipase
MFGDHDWMRYEEAESTVAAWSREGLRADLVIVPKAGHHLYLDNSDYFNSSIKNFIQRLWSL